jgi:hypothetical protein
MSSAIQEQEQNRQREAGGPPQVDVAYSSPAEQLVITVHVDGQGRVMPPPDGFKAAIAAAVQAVVGEYCLTFAEQHARDQAAAKAAAEAQAAAYAQEHPSEAAQEPKS